MEQISEIHSISRISLGKWYTRYERDGLAGLATAKGQGRKTVLRIENQADAQRLEGWVADNAQNLRPVLAQVEEHFGVSICKRTLQRVLKKKTTPGNASETVSYTHLDVYKRQLARRTISCGIPAIWATWIPKLWALPPGLSLRRKMILLSTSFTATLKFLMREKSSES